VPPVDYRTRLGFRPYLAPRPPAPDVRLDAAVRRTQEKDRKYQASQIHAAPISWLFQPPTLVAGIGVSFQGVGAIYTAETTQIVTLIRFSVSLFNAWPASLTGFFSKVNDLPAIAAGVGGDVIVTEARGINGVNVVRAKETYPADIDAPQNHYLSAGEKLFFGVLAQYDTPPGQLFGPVIFGESIVKYIVTGRGFV
jgi:hypothetical protein